METRTRKLNAYAATLAVVGTTANLVGKALPWAGIPGGPALESIGTGMKSAGASAKEGSEALKAQSEASVRSLENQKRELAGLLARLPQPLLVVIDDIDRLTTDEILQVFQLVKANADFPRLIYLLLFEREVVAKALNAISGDKGTEFMEKVIQVGYHVPHASSASVQRVLLTGLDSHIDEMAVSKRWDKARWRDLYSDGIAGYFRNLRHVYRFLASFGFQVRHHRSEGSFEVNPVDLIGLETLRVFEPAVYERLPGAKTILTRYEGPSVFGDIKQEVVDQALSQIVSAAPPETQTKVKTILDVLFPPLSSAYGGKQEVSRHRLCWLRELRVCHPDMFDKYFTMTIADNDLSQAELDNLLALTVDAKRFVAACEALKKRGLLKTAFQRLDAYKEQIAPKSMPSLVQALCDMSDSFPERKPEPFERMFEHDLNAYAWRLCYFRLRNEPDKKKRLQVLKSAFSQSSGLALPCQIVSHDERREERGIQECEFLLEESDWNELKDICVAKLRDASKGSELLLNPHLKVLLWRWSDWATVEEVREWLANHIETPHRAVWLLTVLLSETHSWGQTHKVRYYIDLRTVERFADVAKLTRLIEKVNEAALSGKESAAVREFKKALKRREEGKSDDAWREERDGFEEEIVD